MTEPNDPNSCYYFDAKDCHEVGLARGIAGLVVIVVSLIALIVIGSLKAIKTYAQRLFLYLTLATLLHAPIYIMEVVAVNCHADEYPEAKEPLCTITGTIDMYSSWLQNLMVLWITGYLFRVVVLRKLIKTTKIEICTLILFAIVPIPAAAIPLYHREYGSSGAWCWISSYKESSCHKIDYWGLGYQLGFWYVPFFIETLAVFVTITCISVVFIKRAYMKGKYEQFQSEYKTLLKESLPLLIFPVMYCIINSFEIIVDLLGIKLTHIYWLWMIDAVINPTKAMLVIVGYLVSMILIKQRRWRKNRQEKRNALVVASEENPYGTAYNYGSMDNKTTSFSNEHK